MHLRLMKLLTKSLNTIAILLSSVIILVQIRQQSLLGGMTTRVKTLA